MFQFTREFIVNDLKGKLVAGTGYTLYPSTATTSKLATKDDVLYIDNLTNIVGATVKAAYKHAPQEAVDEVVTVTPTVASGVLAEGDVVRLQIVLGQDGRVISTYNDQYPDHHNQIFVEAVVKTADTLPIADLVANAQKADKKLENVLAKLSTTGSDIVITAVDEFTRVRAIKLVKVKAAFPNAAILTGFEDYVTIVDEKAADFGKTGSVVAVTKAGNVGQGTTNCILRNMRLLTAAHLDPFGTQLDERPLPNAVYTQYTLEVETDRRHIGHQVMGALDTSLTTYVFYVQGDYTASETADQGATVEFENALKALTNAVTPQAYEK